MDKNIRCDLTFCDQYCSCYIELYEAQHPPVQMDKTITCNLNSVISTVYVTSNCMRRNTRQFRWILKCNLKFCDQYCLCYIELYEAQHPPVQINKNILKCDLKYCDWHCLQNVSHTLVLSSVLLLFCSTSSFHLA